MIKHIVIFKLIPPYTLPEKEAAVKKLHDIFEPLGRKLDFVLDYKAGINMLDADFAGDLAIDSLFASEDDLIRYQASTEHQNAIAEASSVRKTKIVVDYAL